MKKINLSYFQYDWLFLKYPGLKNAYQWYQNNYLDYQFLKKIKLFKKYFYSNNINGNFDIFFIGAMPDQLNNNFNKFINLYCITKSYSISDTKIFQIQINNLNNNSFLSSIYDKYKPQEFLKIQDI